MAQVSKALAKRMKSWLDFRNNEFSSEHAEDILWLIFDKALNKRISDFHKLLRRASEGCGYSAQEYLGYSLVNDYDEGTYITGVIEVECGSEEFTVDVTRFAELLKIACNYYTQRDGQHHEKLVSSLYNKFCSVHGIKIS